MYAAYQLYSEMESDYCTPSNALSKRNRAQPDLTDEVLLGDSLYLRQFASSWAILLRS